MKKVRTLGTKRWVCAILVCALLLTTPSLALAASAPEQTAAAQPLTLESIPDELAQTLELDELSPLAELNDTDEENDENGNRTKDEDNEKWFAESNAFCCVSEFVVLVVFNGVFAK